MYESDKYGSIRRWKKKGASAMKRVIISGADGFVGSNTVKYFVDQDVFVTALDMADVPHRLGTNEMLTYFKCDVADSEELIRLLRGGDYDAFIHFAWAGSAGSARIDYNLQMKNALSAVETLKAAKSLGCKRFLCAGSIMEYEVESAVHTQGSRPGMGYIYGMGKQIAHCMCKSVAADIGIDLIWPMITNAYGVGELSPRMLNTTIRKIINDEPLQFTAATQNYDFIYVTDVAKAIYLITEKGKPFCEYMIGSGGAKPLKEFLLELRDELSPERELTFGDIPFTGVDMPLVKFDTSDIQNDCGFKPEVSFAEGIKMTMEWMKSEAGR